MVVTGDGKINVNPINDIPVAAALPAIDQAELTLRAYPKTEPSVSSCVVQETECFCTGTEVDDGDGVVG